MRSVSNIVSVLIVVLVTIAAVALAGVIVMNYAKATQPRGEVVTVKMIVRKYGGEQGIYPVEAILYFSCTGPMCSSYTVSDIKLIGICRETGENYTLRLMNETFSLSSGTKKVVVVGYASQSYRITDVVVSYTLCGPSSCITEYKSASIG